MSIFGPYVNRYGCSAHVIPAHLGFADVRNHLQSASLRERMGGTDVFVYHGYSSILPHGRWVKATPAFDREPCGRFGVAPIDLPFSDIIGALRAHYGQFVNESPPPSYEFTAAMAVHGGTHAKHHARRPTDHRVDSQTRDVDSRRPSRHHTY